MPTRPHTLPSIWRVHFIAVERADTTVEVLPAHASKRRDVQSAEQAEVVYADGVLRIAVPEPRNQLLGSSGSLEVTVKLPAGDMIVYPATSVHRVTPITRGVRVASFFWVQSLVRSDAQRALLFDMDNAIQRLNATEADETARRDLVGCYHNLLRLWSEP